VIDRSPTLIYTESQSDSYDMQLKDECRDDGISNVRLMLNSQADDAEKAAHCYEV